MTLTMPDQLREAIALYDLLQRLGFCDGDFRVIYTPTYFGVLVERCGRRGIFKIGPRQRGTDYNSLWLKAVVEWKQLNKENSIGLFDLVRRSEVNQRQSELLDMLVEKGLYPVVRK